MKYILPKADIFEELVLNTELFFRENNICVSNLSMVVYNDIYSSLIIKALDYILVWKDLPEKEIKKTLSWVYANKRKVKRDTAYYEYDSADEHLTLALARLKVKMEKYIPGYNEAPESYEKYTEVLMEKYYYFVIDAIDLQIKTLLQCLIGNSVWDVFELASNYRTMELINHGDFRILTWEMNRDKK